MFFVFIFLFNTMMKSSSLSLNSNLTSLIKPVFIPSVFLRIDKNHKTGVLRLIAFCHAPRLKHLTRTTTEKALNDLFSLGGNHAAIYWEISKRVFWIRRRFFAVHRNLKNLKNLAFYEYLLKFFRHLRHRCDLKKKDQS